MATYATPSDLVEYYDINLIGQLATDDGVPLSRADITTDDVVLRSLSAASGEVEVNLLASGRYTTTQLAALTGSQAEHLKRLVCAVAMAILVQRRLNAVNSDLARTLIEDSQKKLRDIAKGQNVFGIASVIDAGMPSVSGPTSLDYSRMRLMPDRMGRHFADRAQRLPTDRG